MTTFKRNSIPNHSSFLSLDVTVINSPRIFDLVSNQKFDYSQTCKMKMQLKNNLSDKMKQTKTSQKQHIRSQSGMRNKGI